MLVTLGLLTLLYGLVIMPAYAIICGIFSGMFKSSIRLAPRRARVARKLDQLEYRFAQQQARLQNLRYNPMKSQQQIPSAFLRTDTVHCRKRKSMLPMSSKLAQAGQQGASSQSAQSYVKPVKGRIQQQRRK